MKRAAAIPLLAYLLLSMACSSEPASSTDAAGNDGADAGAGDGACVPTPPPANAEFLCDPTGEGACQGCGDCALVTDGTAKALAAQCGSECTGSSSPTCAKDCLTAMSSISEGCASCLNAFFDCLVANCLAECVGADPAACVACSRAEPSPGPSCSDAYSTCSGVTRNPAYVP